MRGGELSNYTAPAVGVRFEWIIYNAGKLNQPGKAFMESLMSKEVNAYIFTMLGERKAMAFCYKWHVPYSTIFGCESTLEIAELCVAHKMLVYYDTDDRLLELVAGRGTVQTSTIKWEQPVGYQ